MERIVTLTLNPALDVGTSTDTVGPDRKIRCDPPRFEPGGGGINVSRAIANLEGDSFAVYPAGGPPGDMLERFLDEAGIGHVRVPVEDWTRQNLTVREESSGRQYRFVLPGHELTEEEAERCLEALAEVDPPADYLVASGSLCRGINCGFYARVAAEGRDRGARVVVDTSGDALESAVGEGVYLIKPNLRELRLLAGRDLDGEAEQEAAAREIVEKGGSEVVVVSLGAAGALLVTADGSERFRAPTVRIRSKVGAGDSMVAGLVLALAQGSSLEEAVRYGVAAGAAAVMTPGSELCRAEDAAWILG